MAYSIEELICEIDEDRNGIAQLEAIIDQCQRKIYSIQDWLTCEGPEDCDAHNSCRKHSDKAVTERFTQR